MELGLSLTLTTHIKIRLLLSMMYLRDKTATRMTNNGVEQYDTEDNKNNEESQSCGPPIKHKISIIKTFGYKI